jgi:hypothetical protein
MLRLAWKYKALPVAPRGSSDSGILVGLYRGLRRTHMCDSATAAAGWSVDGGVYLRSPVAWGYNSAGHCHVQGSWFLCSARVHVVCCSWHTHAYCLGHADRPSLAGVWGRYGTGSGSLVCCLLTAWLHRPTCIPPPLQRLGSQSWLPPVQHAGREHASGGCQMYHLFCCGVRRVGVSHCMVGVSMPPVRPTVCTTAYRVAQRWLERASKAPLFVGHTAPLQRVPCVMHSAGLLAYCCSRHGISCIDGTASLQGMTRGAQCQRHHAPCGSDSAWCPYGVWR